MVIWPCRSLALRGGSVKQAEKGGPILITGEGHGGLGIGSGRKKLAQGWEH